MKIFDDLYITGIGGSIPGVDLFGQELFEGYPWTSDKEMKESLIQYEKIVGEDMSEKQFIFMSHLGPNVSGTTLVEHEGK